MIKTKSVYSPIDRKRDGLRILATRFRGRYLPVSRYDIWMPNLGPSETLFKLRAELGLAIKLFEKREAIVVNGDIVIE